VNSYLQHIPLSKATDRITDPDIFFAHPGMLMAHSIVPGFECVRSQIFQPIAAQEFKTMQEHKTLKHDFSILRKDEHRMRNVPDYNTCMYLSLPGDQSMSHDTQWLQPLIVLNHP